MVTFKLSDGTLVTLDAAISEKHTGKVTLTQFPVEEGTDPSDAATLQPKEYSVDGGFTNAPLSKEQQDERSDGQFVDKMTDLLWRTLEERKALTIDSPKGRYENMVMTSLSMPGSAEIGEAVMFSADFRQVRFVNTQTVRLAPVQTSVKTKPTEKDKQGTKSSKPATPEQETEVTSTLHDLVGHN